MTKLLALAFFLVPYFSNAQEAIKKEVLKKPERYNVPLFFNPDDVGVKKAAYELSWDLSKKNTLKLGSLTLDADSFVPIFFPAHSKTHPLAAVGDSGADKDTLFLIWPTSLMKYGTLEIIAKDGTVLWSDSFNIKDFKKWQKRVQKVKQQASEEKQKDNKVFFNSAVALTDLSSELLSKINGTFRFCLTQQEGKDHSMLCTPRHIVSKKNGELSLERILEESEARVLVDREEASLAGQKSVEAGQIVSFFSETSTGLGYEFTTQVLPVQLFDIFKDTDGSVLVSGVEPVPFGAGIYEGKNDEDNFWNNLGWQQTMGDLRSYWQMQVPRNKELTLPGRTGGVFRLLLDYQDVPTASQRVWVSGQDVKLTYSDRRTLHLYHTEKQKLQAATGDEIVANTGGQSGEVIWNFPAPNKLEYNTSRIDILEDSKSIKGSYEIYRGHSSELSGRFTAAVDNNLHSIILGEISYNKWFQNLWGWDSDTWSTLHWGFSGRYFKSLNSIGVEGADSTASKTISEVSIMSANLKYRFNPGLWGRDETWGLLGGYQSISIGEVSAPVLGVGFFWARSMPKVFDDLFLYIPYMNYPKFVDVEFTYLPASLDSNVSLGSSYIISFHGKVLWKQSVFGEAGFGMQSYSLEDKGKALSIGLSSFYLTVGLGLNF